MGPIGCPETSVRNYYYSQRNDTEERSSNLRSGGSLKLHTESLLEPRKVAEDSSIYRTTDVGFR